MQPFTILVILLVAAVSCKGKGEESEEKGWCHEGQITEKEIFAPASGVDVLVVVDNSGSMAQEQEMLRVAFPNLIRDILDPPIDPVTGQRLHAPVRDMHIGIVSTDMGVGGYSVTTCEDNPFYGDDGILQHTPHGAGCSSTYPNYIEYAISTTDEPDPAVIDQLATDFGCIAVLGTAGCGFEQQLEAAHKALYEQSAPGQPNAGFLRPDTILAILFVTDEEDCSAADPMIFDLSGIVYAANLQCYYNPMKLHIVDRYIDDLKALKGGTPGGDTPTNLVVGFIVGVPPGETACEGRGDELGGCLDVDAMVERVRPTNDLLEYVCTYPPGCTPQVDCSSEAFPGRRYVQVAQGLGGNAVVQSICTNSFVPAVQALTEKIEEAIENRTVSRQIPMAKDPNDPTGCRCLSKCYFIEELSDNRGCPAEKLPWDGNHDGVPDTKIDEETGLVHTLCEIPQAGSITSDCTLPCDSAAATYTKDPNHQGWWYDPMQQQVILPVNTVETGSKATLQCCACAEDKRCGPASWPEARCCSADEECYYIDNQQTGYCLVPRNTCEEYGDDLVCPGAGPLVEIGGLCCLDPDMDGVLNWVMKDEDGDTVPESPDFPAYTCIGQACVPR